MYNVVPKRKIVKRRHEIFVELTLCKILDCVGQYAKGQHVGHHKADDRRCDHESAAQTDGRLAQGEKHEHQRPKKQADLELEWVCNSPPKITESKTLTYSGRVSHRLRPLLLGLSSRFAHGAAERADLDGAAVRVWT